MEFKYQHPGFYAFIDAEKRIYHQRLCLVPKGAMVPGHACIGPNRVIDIDGCFRVQDLMRYVSENKPEPVSVSFSDIWHQLHGPDERQWTIENDPRYQKVDLSFPGILSPLRNPQDKPYRMLDGRRRMWKQQEAGSTEGLFYIIPEPEVYECFWMVMPLDKHLSQLSRLTVTE